MKKFRNILYLLAALLSTTACKDELLFIEGETTPSIPESGLGQMVLFSAGTTTNSVQTRAGDDGSNTETPGKTYYMPSGFRFVCRMYYKASTAENAKYDVSSGSDVITWLKVDGDVGNSLYWRNSFPTLTEGTPSPFDSYGNDAEATCFYWQNRKEHAFLAWTDLNKATTIGYDPTPNSGTLKFKPEDEMHTIHTGVKQNQWIEQGYEVMLKDGETQVFSSWAELRTYLETGDNYQNVKDATLPDGVDFTDQQYYYAYGWSCKYRAQKGIDYESVDGNHRKYGWYEYQMFYDKITYKGATSGTSIETRKNVKGEPAFLYNKDTKQYLAEIEINFYKLDEQGTETSELYTPGNTDINSRTNVILDRKTVQSGDKIKNAVDGQEVAVCSFEYHLTDQYGNVKYDENTPRYTFYYKMLQENKESEVTKVLPANVFDLTRGSKTSITEQPDIVQALTKQAPLGATQSANRVNLYFKHQFSMVQVNVKSSADLSVVINKKHIKKVELLGVTEKGYVFTEMDEDGEVEPATYESVDVSKYSDEDLKKNQYGTAFEMFDMATGKDDAGNQIADDDVTTHDAGYATGYIKSFNALTFGELQAIRITWVEEGNTGIEHQSTYTVADAVLKHLKSGNKYIWNIELRRGTLAIVRTEIVDWIVPTNELEYHINGTIKD